MARVNTLIDGVTGHACIWTGNDDLPFIDPFGHANRVKYSSKFRYRKIIDVRAFTVSLPRTFSTDEYGIKRVSAANQLRTVSYALFAHGRPGTPWVRGRVTLGGQVVSISGSVPVQKSGPATSGFMRCISLGADATHVRLFEYAVQQRGSNNESNNPYDAISLPITVYVTDKVF